MNAPRFTRHAKNRMRLYKVTREEAEAIVAGAITTGADSCGNLILIGIIEDGRKISIVVALDDPGLVITLIDTST